MKKLLITCLSVGAFFTASDALAQDFTQYVAGRVSFVDLQNKANNRAVFNGNGTLFPNTIVDGTLHDNVAGLRVAYGVQMDMPQWWGKVRGEIEYSYNGEAKERGSTTIDAWGQNVHLNWREKTRSMGVMANAYYEFDTKTKVSPYIGAGLGWARLKTSANGEILNIIVGGTSTNIPFSGSEHRNNLAWNVQAGLSYTITRNWVMDLGYRYTDLGHTKSSSVTDSGTSSAKYKIRTQEVSLGVRYHF